MSIINVKICKNIQETYIFVKVKNRDTFRVSKAKQNPWKLCISKGILFGGGHGTRTHGAVTPYRISNAAP